MNTKSGFLLILVVLFQIVPVQFALAQPLKMSVAENGEALLWRSSSGQKEQVKDSVEIGFGDTLFTLADADARIWLESQSTLLVKGGSVIVLNAVGTSDGDIFGMDISLEDVQIFFDRNQQHKQLPFRILTKGYGFTPTGTAAAVKTTRQGVPTVAVLRGSVLMTSSQGGSVTVEARQFGTVNSVGVLVSGSLNEKGLQQLETWSGVKAQTAVNQNAKKQGSSDLDNEASIAVSDTLNANDLQAQSGDGLLNVEQAALISTSKNRSKSSLRLGVRDGASMNSYSVEWGYTRGMGYGAEAGLAAKYLFTNRLSLNTEVNFCYRILSRSAEKYYSDNIVADEIIFAGNDVRESITEKAVLVPVMFQFTPSESSPFYMLTGVQLGVPFKHKYDYKYKMSRYDDGKLLRNRHMTFSDYVRSKVDTGITLGVGSKITPNLGLDFRYVINVNDVYDRDKVFDGWQGRATLTNFTLGINCFL